jgi:hypothetical protein
MASARPKQTESKYFNALDFFDHVKKEQRLAWREVASAVQFSERPTTPLS